MLAQLVSASAQEAKQFYVHVRIPAEFFFMSDAIAFFIDNFYDYLFCNMVIFGIKMTAIKFPIE